MDSFGEEKIDFSFEHEKAFLNPFGPEEEKKRSDSREKLQEIDKVEVEPDKDRV